MEQIKKFFNNKWVGFTLATIIYVLWFVVWTGNWWLILGVGVIYDLYISKYFYRYVWSKNEKLCEISSLYRNIYEWVNAIVFATVAATLIHIFIFQMYVIPSSSMEKSLLVGDYLYVSKVTYGPQMPNTPLSFPFVHHTMPLSQTKKSFSEAIKWPYHRLKGLREIERGDVFVFNFPAGDTVLLENQAVTYYDVLRDYQEQYGPTRGRKQLENDYTIITRPVDKRENYIKRCVALPGDSIRIIDRELPDAAKEVLLVLDATTGQNAVVQAAEFSKATGITGIVLTKLDGTAKGGVVLAIKDGLQIPVKYIGVGEQVDDLQPFSPSDFAKALFDKGEA